jgi:ABC-type branched-subunit amino acid transport system ATPase component
MPPASESTTMASTDPGSPGADPAAAALLEVSDLHCSFGGIQAVAGATFQARQGTFTGLIGPNGAGKSTVVNIIGGQIKPDSGAVFLAGAEITGRTPYEISRRGITRTFQAANIFPRLTVLENLLIGASPWNGESFLSAVLGKWRWGSQEAELTARAQEILERFELTRLQNEYAGELSGGQRRLVEIMRALMSEPKVLLLDEPMAGINPTLAGWIGEMLTGLLGAGMTLIMVEHDLNLVERICDRVICMVQGRVLAEGTMAELRDNQEVVDAYLEG